MIHRIRIQNFKSIADVDVELSPVTVLVGKSGAGKSNFVEAIRVLRDLLTDVESIGSSDWDRWLPAAKNGEAMVRFEVEFSI
ncbi:MAG: AAA family ATPase [Planctomycetales bacterium]